MKIRQMIRGLLNFGNRRMVGPTIRDGLEVIRELIEREISEGKIARQPVVQIPADQIENALVESLAQT